MIEFESTALMIGQLGLRVNLIAYPVVSVKKVIMLDNSISSDLVHTPLTSAMIIHVCVYCSLVCAQRGNK